MIPNASKISDLPRDIVQTYRTYGWTNDEILEHWGDAVNFVNARLRRERPNAEITLEAIFPWEKRASTFP